MTDTNTSADERNSAVSEQPAFHLDQEVDLFEYAFALLRHKYKIVAGATLLAIAAFGFSLLVQEKFIASVLVAINVNEEPGGVSPSNYRTSDTLGLFEHDFIIDSANAHSNARERMLATMTAMKFSVEFIREQNLLPYLFSDQWDASTESWIDDFQPDMRRASIAFDGIRGIKLDEDTGLLTVFFTTNNPQLSSDLANAFIESFNRYTKAKQSEIIASRRDYLNKRLGEIDNVELHRSIFRMIETQLATESLLHARRDYPLEVIQPALPPLYKAAPQRKLWAVLALFGGVFLGVMVVIGSVLLTKVRAGLAHYQLGSAQRSADAKAIAALEPDSAAALQAEHPDKSADSWVD